MIDGVEEGALLCDTLGRFDGVEDGVAVGA